MLLHPLVSENAKSSSLLQPHQIVFATQCSPCISVKQKQPQPNQLQQHRIIAMKLILMPRQCFVAIPATICHKNPINGCYSSFLQQLMAYELQQKNCIAIWPHITTTIRFGGNTTRYCTQFSGLAIVTSSNRGETLQWEESVGRGTVGGAVKRGRRGGRGQIVGKGHRAQDGRLRGEDWMVEVDLIWIGWLTYEVDRHIQRQIHLSASFFYQQQIV